MKVKIDTDGETEKLTLELNGEGEISNFLTAVGWYMEGVYDSPIIGPDNLMGKIANKLNDFAVSRDNSEQRKLRR